MAVLELTTLERVKAYGTYASPVAPATDTLLGQMIKSVSQRMSEYCSRSFEKASKTELRTASGAYFPVLCSPFSALSSVRVSSTGRRADLIALDSTQYDIAPDNNGVNLWGVLPGSLVEVVYTGGLAANTADVIASFPSLENACLLQVTTLYKRHAMPDRQSTDMGNGSTQWTGEYDLLDEVKSTLDQNYNARHLFL